MCKFGPAFALYLACAESKTLVSIQCKLGLYLKSCFPMYIISLTSVQMICVVLIISYYGWMVWAITLLLLNCPKMSMELSR